MSEHVTYSHFTLKEDDSLVIRLSDGSEIVLDPMATYVLGAFMYQNISRKIFPSLPHTDELIEIVEAMNEKEKGNHNEH